MSQLTKLKTTLKPIITTLSVLALCCSTMSYAGDDKNKDYSAPSKPYFYTGANEDEAILFEQSILENSRHFAVNLALKTFAPAIYHVLQDTKTNLFQQNQIALMQDVLDELKAVNQKLSDRPGSYNPREFHQKIKEIMNGLEMPSSGDVVGLAGDVEFAFLRPQAKLNALFAKNRITELPMKPKTQAMDDYYIDSSGLKKRKITPPEIKAGCGGMERINQPNFNFIGGDALALAQEIFNRPSFQNEIAAMIQQEISKAINPVIKR